MPTVHLLDYVAGNVRSLANAIEKIGYQIEWIKEPNDIQYAEVRSNALDSELLPQLKPARRSLYYPVSATSDIALPNFRALDTSSQFDSI